MPELTTEPPEHLKDHPLFSGGQFGIMTAESPKFKAELHGENPALEHHLNKLGLKYEKIQGKYDVPENSYIIHNPTRGQMINLGKQFGQESVIHSSGGRHLLVYTNGPSEGKYIQTAEPHISYFQEKPQDYYSTVPGHPGFFRLNFDFNNVLPQEISQQPPPVGSSGNLSANTIGKHEIMPTTVTIQDLSAALLERLKKAEASLIELAKKEGELGHIHKPCPLCGEKQKNLTHHLDSVHEHEMRQRRMNPDDPVVNELKGDTKKAEGKEKCSKCGGGHEHGYTPLKCLTTKPTNREYSPGFTPLEHLINTRTKKAEPEKSESKWRWERGDPQAGARDSIASPETKQKIIQNKHRKELDREIDPEKIKPLGTHLKSEGLPGQNPSLPNPIQPNLNAPSESPVGSGNEVPVGQIGPEGQACMETGGGTCPLCGQEDVPGKCTCLGPATPPAQPDAGSLVNTGQPLAQSEKGFKRAWADYDKRAKAAKAKHIAKGDAPIMPTGEMNLACGEAPAIPTGMNLSEKMKKDVPPTVPDMGGRGGGAYPTPLPQPTSGLALSEMCKACGKSGAMCKCVAKADFIDQDTHQTVERGVIGKRPPAASKIPVIPSQAGKVVPNKYAIKKAEKVEPLMKPPVSQAQRAAMGAAASGNSTLGIPKKVGKEFIDADKGGKLSAKKAEPEQSAEELNRLPPPNAPRITSRARAVGGLPAIESRRPAQVESDINDRKLQREATVNTPGSHSGNNWYPKGHSKYVAPAKKAEPPMAKPPSGKNPATMTPTAKPAAGAMPKPVAVPKPVVSAPKTGLMGKAELDKALAPPMAAMAQQHGLIAGSKAAGAGGAPSLPAGGASRSLQHPADPGRANAMQQALQGAFQPKGPVSSGLELARAPKPSGLKAPPMGIRKSEELLNYGCPFCHQADHFGDCPTQS